MPDSAALRWILCLAMVVAAACGASEPASDDDSSHDDRQPDAAADDETPRLITLATGWSETEQKEFYTTPLGNRLVPEAWFFALEDATTGAMLADRTNLEAIGLLYDAPDDRLPIGLVSEPGPGGGWIGNTCSSCHTTELTYEGDRIRVLGGTGKFILNAYLGKIFVSVVATAGDPAKFDAFAARVLGDGAPADQVAALRAGLQTAADGFTPVLQAIEQLGLHPTPQGPGRFALNEVLTNVSASKIDPRNLRPELGQAGAMAIWGTDELQWMHSDGQNESRIARNALGFSVFDAFVSFDPVQVNWNPDVIHRIAIELPAKLEAPAWPAEILGAIDEERAARGEAIYERLCAGCHEPTHDGRFLQRAIVPVAEIGTDSTYIDAQLDPGGGPRQLFTGPLAATMFADVQGDPREQVELVEYFRVVSQAFMDAKYAELGLTADEIERLQDGRQNVWRFTGGYVASTLDGIWATAPYLHNDSVANLYELLSPAAERAASFRIGGDIDPENVGYRVDGEVGFPFDTSLTSNGNGGHEGEAFGTTLTDYERYDLIEYLKTR
jgi:hypothetical protein